MIASPTELAQMKRDGRGRPDVVKRLVEFYQNAMAHQVSQQDSVLMHGRWVHYLTSSCTHGKPPEFIRIVHRDMTETEVELK